MLQDTAPLVPLSLDRVIGDEPITSSLPLFRLPVELISRVTSYLSPVDIQCLSLVDRDSNQLARALQFAHITFDYSPHAIEILTMLKGEVESPVSRRRIGVCVRRLRVSTARQHFNAREGIELGDLEGLSLEERLKRIEAAKQTEARYLRSICNLLCHLPNLHILDWTDEGPLTPKMMESIMASSIRHLRLDGPILNSQSVIPPASDGSWPLEGLYLNVGWSLTTSTEGDTSPFVSRILKLVAPTLRQFIWCGYADRLSPPTHRFEEVIQFPALRDIVVDQTQLKDSSLLQRILGERTALRSLSVDSSSTISQFLVTRGHIPSLESFRWDWNSSTSEDKMLEFIHQNSQLSCLEVTAPLLPETIDSILLRNNQLHFDHLVSLHLVSQNVEFLRETLDTIASITSLKHLWLSAGAQYGMRYQWAVDHDLIIESLKPLTRLETLVFTRDSYHVNGHPLLDTSPERYYMNKVLPRDLLLNDYLTEDELTKAGSRSTSVDQAVLIDREIRLRDTLRCITWERWHQCQMVMYATEYSSVFGQLKWCFMGQLPMRIEESMFWRVAELEREERDPGLKTLYAYWERVVRNVV